MKAYVVTSGVVFLLVLAAHVARIAAEGSHLLAEPSFVFTSLLTVALALWAWRVFVQLSRRSADATGAGSNVSPEARVSADTDPKRPTG